MIPPGVAVPVPLQGSVSVCLLGSSQRATTTRLGSLLPVWRLVSTGLFPRLFGPLTVPGSFFAGALLASWPCREIFPECLCFSTKDKQPHPGDNAPHLVIGQPGSKQGLLGLLPRPKGRLSRLRGVEVSSVLGVCSLPTAGPIRVGAEFVQPTSLMWLWPPPGAEKTIILLPSLLKGSGHRGLACSSLVSLNKAPQENGFLVCMDLKELLGPRCQDLAFLLVSAPGDWQERDLGSLCGPVLSLAPYLSSVALLGVVGKSGKGQE